MAVLVITSSRAHADTQELLRVHDTVTALMDLGKSVDLLVPMRIPLLDTCLPPSVRVFTIPHVPMMQSAPPGRPSLRRTVIATLMCFRAVALLARREYGAVHGFDDGAAVAMAAVRFSSIRPRPYVAEFRSPLSRPGFFRSPGTAVARFFERRAFRRAAAVILDEERLLDRFGRGMPLARVSIIPDPHVEIAPDAYTSGEFSLAVERIYDYILRPSRRSRT